MALHGSPLLGHGASFSRGRADCRRTPTRQPIADRRTVILARSYALTLPERWWVEITEATRNRADRALVASVIAIEAGNRGRLLRRVENAYARALLVVRAERRFLRLSLGIAQLQPRTLGLAFSRESIDLLNERRYAIDACTSVVTETCTRCGMDPLSVGRWYGRDFRSFGWAYNGSQAYGHMLAATYAQVRTRFG